MLSSPLAKKRNKLLRAFSCSVSLFYYADLVVRRRRCPSQRARRTLVRDEAAVKLSEAFETRRNSCVIFDRRKFLRSVVRAPRVVAHDCIREVRFA